MRLISEHSSEFEDPANEIDFVLNLAPNQSEKLSDPAGVDAYSVHHGSDLLSGNAMAGLKAAFSTAETIGGMFGGHDIKSFNKDLKSFLKAWNESKKDSDKLIQNFISEMKKYHINVKVQGE